MNSLLEYVLEAHGGLDLWNCFSDTITDVEVGGQICERYQLTESMQRFRLFLSLREQRAVIALPGTEKKLLVHPDMISLLGERGTQLASLIDPHATLMKEDPETPWDVLRSAYFVANLISDDVKAPFLYTHLGFQTEEIEPWQENGEIWRVLKVTFPRYMETQTRIQYAYYGSDGLLRRRRCKVDILGGLDFTSYVKSHERVNGIVIPTRWETSGCEVSGRKLAGPPLVTVRLSSTFFSD